MSTATSVVHSVPTWLPRTATYLYNLVRFLPPEVRSSVVCRTTENIDQFQVQGIHARDSSRIGLQLDRVLNRAGLRRFPGNLVPTARAVRAEVLHSHWGSTAWDDLEAARRLGLAHVITFYGKDVNFLPQQDPVWLERYAAIFQNCARVLCEGPFMAQAIVGLGCPAEKVTVQRLGVEMADIEYRPRVWDGSGPLRFLLSASFREKKGLPDALAAIGLFRSRTSTPVEVTIIGGSSQDLRSQHEEGRIHAALDDHDLRPATRLLGYQPHAVTFQEAYKAHVFISPSRMAEDGDTEGGAPVTLIEMAATGTAIISTTHCDIPSVVVHGETGLLAPEGDVETLTAHITELVSDTDRWQQMLAAGRRHVERDFDVHTQAQALAGVYQECARSRS